MSGQTVSSRPIQFSAPGNDLNLKKKKKKKKQCKNKKKYKQKGEKMATCRRNIYLSETKNVTVTVRKRLT